MKLVMQNKLIKPFLIVVTFIWLFILLVIIISAYLFNPNEHKTFITHKFFTATGRTLILNGPIEFRMFPTLHLVVKNFIITNPPQLGTKNFIEANSLNADISILPLIKGTFNFNYIVLEGVQFNFMHNQYINNWTFKPATNNGQSTNINLVINNLILRNAKVNYSNLTNNEQINTKKFNLFLNMKGGAIKLDDKKVKLSKVTISVNDELQGALNGKIMLDPEFSYAGEAAINKFSLPSLYRLLNIKLPRIFNTYANTNITGNSIVEASVDKLILNKLNINLGKMLVSGNVNIGFKPYKISQNLVMMHGDVADFINLKGFKLKFESAALNGSLSTDDSQGSSLTGEESMHVRQIILYGLDVKRFNAQVNKAINDISVLRKLFTYTRTAATVKNLKQTIDEIEGEKKKSYSNITNLGNFSVNAVAKRGNLSLSKCKLDGPDVVGICSGYVNFSSRTMDILAQGRLLPEKETSVINYIYLPYAIKGRFSGYKYGLEWGYIAQEITAYYNFKDKD
ncbi:MAG: AsmA family protein [Burkholderiales bacterium]|nr:AsmA family protein [Burkholderiales bacterium]